MGTRNLTCVIKSGEFKVAQYGQWDGYPEGQGATILEFLRGEGNIEKLTDSLTKVRHIDKEGKDKQFIEEHNKNAPEWSSDTDNRTAEQKRWFKTYITRDLGGEILANIANSDDDEILIMSDIAFASDGLMCEWSYIIDLDNNIFEVYDGGFDVMDRQPTKSYSLDDLPDTEQFISDLTSSED